MERFPPIRLKPPPTITLWTAVLWCTLLLSLELPQSCQAFQSHFHFRPASTLATSTTNIRILQQQQKLPQLFSASNNNDANSSSNDEENKMNVEKERQKLESLLGTTTDGDDTTIDLLSLPLSEWKRDLQQPPLLTSIGRERRETEIALLESLVDSDEAIPELWDLWYKSRGPQPARELMATERLVAQGQPEAWKQAEHMLRKLIAKEGIHWVEPVNRLATLMFLQNRQEESLELCLLVLALKPWHFGALSGVVMVYRGLQDNTNMLKYALQRMPPLPASKEEATKMEEQSRQSGGKIETRQAWVDRMVGTAKDALVQEEKGIEDSFQDLDKATTAAAAAAAADEGNDNDIRDTDDKDAWQ